MSLDARTTDTGVCSPDTAPPSTLATTLDATLSKWEGPGPITSVSNTVEVDRSVTVMPLSDVHWPNHHHQALTLWREVVEATPDAKVVLVGDLFDLERTTETMQLQPMDPHGGVRELVETHAEKCVKDLAEFLRPIASRIVGCVPGNHTHLFRSGHTSEEKLMLELELWHLYRPIFHWTRIRFIDGQSRSVVIHHYGGSKGGTTMTGDLNGFKKAELGFGGADAMIFGHTHRKHTNVSDYRPLVMKEDGTLVSKPGVIYVRTGTFAKHEFDGPGAYAAKRMYAPTEHGWTWLKWLLLPSGRIVSDKGDVTL